MKTTKRNSTSELYPWSQSAFVEKAVYPLNAQEYTAIKREVMLWWTRRVPIRSSRWMSLHDPGHLGFFVTRDASRNALNIGSENALYDPRHDVVLLDEQFVRPFAVHVGFSDVRPE
jgi:hypothetical protein